MPKNATEDTKPGVIEPDEKPSLAYEKRFWPRILVIISVAVALIVGLQLYYIIAYRLADAAGVKPAQETAGLVETFEEIFKLPEPNTDPKAGWVRVYEPDGTYAEAKKMCDGTTMLYKSDQFSNRRLFSSEANHPECQP